MERGRRIPLHDHSSRWEGGRIAGHAIVTATGGDSSPIGGGGGGGTGGPTTAAGVSLADAPGNYAADNVEDAFAEVADDLAAIEADIAALEATDVAVDSSRTGVPAEDQQTFDDLVAAALGWSVDSVGSITAGGSPQTVVGGDGFNNEFPGLARLDASRVLLCYRRGTDHFTDGDIYGQIGTLNDDRSAATWDTQFLIYSNAVDIRYQDGVSVIDGKLVNTYDLRSSSNRHDPSIIICDDAPGDFTATSTWSAPIAIPLTTGTTQNYAMGKVHKLVDGSYMMGAGYQGSGTHTVGIWKWTGSVDDPSGGSFITIGSGANDYAEIAFVELPDGTLRAHIRTASGTSHYKSASTDHGATWSAPSVLYTAEGYPDTLRTQSGQMLTVYRHSPNGDTGWRTSSTDDDTGWGSETILDSTGSRSAYASMLQVTPNAIMCAYAIEYSSDGLTGGADVRIQWFTDASTFAASLSAGEPVADAHIADTTDAHDMSAISVADAGDYFSGTDGEAVLQEVGASLASLALSGGSGATDHFHIVDEQFSGDGATTVFPLANEAVPDSVMAYVAGTRTPVTLGGSMNDQITFGSAPGAGTLNVSVDYAAASH